MTYFQPKKFGHFQSNKTNPDISSSGIALLEVLGTVKGFSFGYNIFLGKRLK
jgi:hypothetical protein